MRSLVKSPSADPVQGDVVSFDLPADATSEQLRDSILALAGQIAKREAGTAVRYFALWQMLARAKEDQGFLEIAGFATFGDFEDDMLAKSGLTRDSTTFFNWKRIHAHLPELTPTHLNRISAGNLMLITKVPESKRPAALEMAVGVSNRRFKITVEEAGYLSAAETEGGANLIISGGKEEVRELREWLEHQQITTHVGSERPIDVLLAAKHETPSSGWPDV